VFLKCQFVILATVYKTEVDKCSKTQVFLIAFAVIIVVALYCSNSVPKFIF